MFNFNTEKKCKKQVLAKIDEYQKELREELEEAYSKLEGYSKAKEKIYIKFYTQKIVEIEGQIHVLDILRIRVR